MVTASVLVGLNVRTRTEVSATFSVVSRGWPMAFSMWEREPHWKLHENTTMAELTSYFAQFKEMKAVENSFPMRVTVDLCATLLILVMAAVPLELWLRKRTASEPEPIKI